MPLNSKSKMTCPNDAEILYGATASADPFPNIPPALLNSADIHDYIEATGMVYPYDSSLMKTSSYEAQVGDKAIYWDQEGIKRTVDLNVHPEVILKPNSLVFIETQQEFRLPSYMAIRFNLRITLVHRGLLLGTGPLVDPGFCGKLLIPIHNLTNNTYTFKAGEKFIWVEFTKVSPNKAWDKATNRINTQSGKYEPFPEDKKWRTPVKYFEKANDGNPINNAVPAAMELAKKQAKKALERSKQISWAGLIAILAFVAGFFPMFYDSMNLSTDITKMISDFQIEYQSHVRSESSLEEKINELEGSISKLESEIQNAAVKADQQNQIDQMQEDIRVLRDKLNSLKAIVTKLKTSPEKTD